MEALLIFTASHIIIFEKCIQICSETNNQHWKNKTKKTSFLSLSSNLYHTAVITGATILWSSHCNSFEDQAPVDFIYGCLIFKWVAVTWQEWKGTRIVAPVCSIPIIAHLPIKQSACISFVSIQAADTPSQTRGTLVAWLAAFSTVCNRSGIMTRPAWRRSPGEGKGGLTHWGPVTHICVSKLTIMGSHNSLPGQRQTIIWINAGILLTGP